MSRVPIRIRLAAAFSAGLIVVMGLVGGFVYVRVGNELTRALDTSLATRADDLGTLVQNEQAGTIDLGGIKSGEGESTFTQILDPNGQVVDSTVAGPAVLDSGQLAQARVGEITFTGLRVADVEAQSRALAFPLQAGDRSLIAVVGATTSDREEAKAGVVRALVVGAPFAVLLASLIGYILGARAMTPVELMRSRAREISLHEGGERLPMPPAKDELRRLAETLNEMLDRIEEVLRRERVFVSDASHELRSPLAILKSEIEVIGTTGGTKEELEAALDSVGEEVDLLIRLAEDLLIVARADGGRLPIKREPVDTGRLLARVSERHSARAARNGCRLVVADGGPQTIQVDPVRLEQALGNLVDNAVRYGAGTVTLQAAQSGDGEVLLSVSDQGEGFPPGFATEAFERFARASTGRGGSSSGLGLAIVRAIARAHGGDAAIVERDQPGATVVISIPNGI